MNLKRLIGLVLFLALSLYGCGEIGSTLNKTTYGAGQGALQQQERQTSQPSEEEHCDCGQPQIIVPHPELDLLSHNPAEWAQVQEADTPNAL